MTHLVVNPQFPQEEFTSELVSFQIYVEETDWRGYFDQIQVFRSRGSSAGPYEELTASQLRAAQVPASAGPSSSVAGASVALVGRSLELRANERDDVVVTFTGSDPLTFAAAAAQVITQGRMKVTAWVDSEGQFVVGSLDVGTGAALEVTGGDAAPTLGLPLVAPTNLDFGEAARIPLQVGKQVYTFQDVRGSRHYFYRTRFLNRTNGAKSEYSQVFSSAQVVGVNPAYLVEGYVSLVDASGKPLVRHPVHLHTEYNGSIVDGKTVAGGDLVEYTDETGRAEFTLVRGQLYSVALPGTDLNRQILSPTDTDVVTFNLLDADVATGQDMFKVVVPNMIVAERRTL